MLEELAQDVLDIGLNAAMAGASHVTIRISENRADDVLIVTVADNGRGMSPELRRNVLDGFSSTKNNSSKTLGLGIALLRQAADLCGGRFKLFSHQTRGTIISARMQRSHIDRPPLGDLAGSIMALCGTEERMIVHYEHRFEGRVFQFDSSSIADEAIQPAALNAMQLLDIERRLIKGEWALRETAAVYPVG